MYNYQMTHFFLGEMRVELPKESE